MKGGYGGRKVRMDCEIKLLSTQKWRITCNNISQLSVGNETSCVLQEQHMIAQGVSTTTNCKTT